MPSHSRTVPFMPQKLLTYISWPMSRSFRSQIAVWVPYPLALHGAVLCHRIRLKRRSFSLLVSRGQLAGGVCLRASQDGEPVEFGPRQPVNIPGMHPPLGEPLVVGDHGHGEAVR